MEPGSYSNPIGESVSHSAQRAAQLVSISVAAAQGYAIFRSRQAAIRAAEDEQEQRALRDQARRNYQQARLGWAPALDPRWLRQADLGQAARTWGAAVVYADGDTSAANAMLAVETRLRALHPYGMRRYDRLRADGLSPIDAMTQAAPFFTRHPFAREGEPGRPRTALTTTRPGGTESWPGRAHHDDGVSTRAEQSGASELSHAIADSPAAAAGGTAHKTAAAAAAALAAQCFPVTASQALRAAAGTSTGTTPAPGRKPTRQHAMRPPITG